MAAPLTLGPALPRSDRDYLVRRAKWLAWGSTLWHIVEFAIAVGAGVLAGSIALIGFGADSLIEAAAGGIVLWRFTGQRTASDHAERRAQQLIAATYFLLAAYIVAESARTFLGGTHPDVSWIGIGLAALTAPTMPILARAKQRLGRALGSQATSQEGTQNMLCAYLSVALLLGLGANAVLGWWWADPLTALAIAGVAVKEGVAGWRGEVDSCCAVPLPAGERATGGCQDACCNPGADAPLTLQAGLPPHRETAAPRTRE